MRLINCRTLQLEEFLGKNIPPYAILSHTWGDQEVSFTEFNSNQSSTKSKEGYRKISFTCRQASHAGLQYAWVDTCCIDKSSSAELSEAINSMFHWYENSVVCYAYLSDVDPETLSTTFQQSRWFGRGWTLQELIAPPNVIFFDRDGNELCTRNFYSAWISEITGIDEPALQGLDRGGNSAGRSLEQFCAGRRMSWASNRETTRVEDIAYALLGIFDVNIPLLYGEGEKAFSRLQEEIIRSTHDDSILAWGLDTGVDQSPGVPYKVEMSVTGGAAISPLLADSPRAFRHCHRLEYGNPLDSPFTMTNLGLEVEIPLVPVYPSHNYSDIDQGEIQGWIGLLKCGVGVESEVPGVVLWPFGGGASYLQVGRVYYHAEHRESRHTVLVNARVAAQATLTKVIILKDDRWQYTRGRLPGSRQVFVNESPQLSAIGYSVSAASGTDFIEGPQLFPFRANWNLTTQVLSVSREYGRDNLLQFQFNSQKKPADPEFSVFICGANANVHRGSEFSSTEERRFYELLKDHSPQGDEEDSPLTCSDGSKYKIVVAIRTKRVNHWTIVEVDVDAAKISGEKHEKATDV